jgi:dihydrofolate reductase
MVDPVVIGKGTTIFQNMKHRLNLKLVRTKTFDSGIILLSYTPADNA